MTNDKTISVFNKGQRTFQLLESKLRPNTSASLKADEAEFLLGKYPQEIIEASSIHTGGGSDKALKAENAALKAEVATLKESVKALEGALKDVTSDVEDNANDDEFSKMTKKELVKLFDERGVVYETDANVGRLREIARIEKATALAEAATA